MLVKLFHNISALSAALLLAAFPVSASAFDALWITGDAVPGGKAQLLSMPDGSFKYAGSLLKGSLRIVTTENASAERKYVAPRYEDAYIVNNGEPYILSSDSTRDGWVVPFSEDFFRFYVDVSDTKVKGELFKPWHEVFIAGGAVDCGWHAFLMDPMTQDAKDPCVWTWEGELKNRKENVEPKRFKLMGQDNWGPKSLHPYVQDEAALSSTVMRTGGDDTKWSIGDDGYYRITVDVFHETFKAEYLGTQPSRGNVSTAVSEAPSSAVLINTTGKDITVSAPGDAAVSVFSADGGLLKKKKGRKVIFHAKSAGVYIVKVICGDRTESRKTIVE